MNDKLRDATPSRFVSDARIYHDAMRETRLAVRFADGTEIDKPLGEVLGTWLSEMAEPQPHGCEVEPSHGLECTGCGMIALARMSATRSNDGEDCEPYMKEPYKSFYEQPNDKNGDLDVLWQNAMRQSTGHSGDFEASTISKQAFKDAMALALMANAARLSATAMPNTVPVPRSLVERTEAMFRSVDPAGAIAQEWALYVGEKS